MDRLDDKNITRFGAAARKLLREATTESDHMIGTMLENAYHNLTKEALARPSNMVAVPADQLEKMQKELKRLRNRNK